MSKKISKYIREISAHKKKKKKSCYTVYSINKKRFLKNVYNVYFASYYYYYYNIENSPKLKGKKLWFFFFKYTIFLSHIQQHFFILFN